MFNLRHNTCLKKVFEELMIRHTAPRLNLENYFFIWCGLKR